MEKQKILLLGGFGFIGSNILSYIDSCQSCRYSVIVFDRLDRHPLGFCFECVEKVYAGDFANTSLLEEIFKENKIDLVIHSLSSTVPLYSKNALFDITTNLIPTISFLELMKGFVRKIVYISSGGAIYGESESIMHSETDRTEPKNSYGVIKLTIEKYLNVYNQLYGLQPLILRLSNPYGPYHSSHQQGFINIALRRARAGECITILGDGENIKDYIYIDDVCKILFILLNKECFNTTVNVGAGVGYSLNEIISYIKELIPQLKVDKTHVNQMDTRNFILDNSKCLNLIGDFAFTSLKEGLDKTTSWLNGK